MAEVIHLLLSGATATSTYGDRGGIDGDWLGCESGRGYSYGNGLGLGLGFGHWRGDGDWFGDGYGSGGSPKWPR